jgi:hypothetical protein
MGLLLVLLLLLLFLHTIRKESFVPATESSIGLPVKYLPEPEISMVFPEYGTTPDTSKWTPVLHSGNFKFPESVIGCLEEYIKQYTKEKFILHNIQNVYFEGDMFVFEMDIVFTEYIFSKRYRIQMEIKNHETCNVLSIEQAKVESSNTKVIYGKLDNRYYIRNAMHLMRPFV